MNASRPRRDQCVELDRRREATRLTEKRFRPMETRLLLKIDRERNESRKLPKTLDVERSAGTDAL